MLYLDDLFNFRNKTTEKVFLGCTIPRFFTVRDSRATCFILWLGDVVWVVSEDGAVSENLNEAIIYERWKNIVPSFPTVKNFIRLQRGDISDISARVRSHYRLRLSLALPLRVGNFIFLRLNEPRWKGSRLFIRQRSRKTLSVKQTTIIIKFHMLTIAFNYSQLHPRVTRTLYSI